jgi:uncharacterized membrane protein
MEYVLLRLVHILGLTLMTSGLIGVLLADLRSRQVRELVVFAEAVRSIAVCYDGLVVPGAVLLAGSGAWLIADFYDGWAFVETPWLAGMVALFVFEFVEGNTVTRLYFLRLRRLTVEALRQGRFTAELEQARGETTPTFTHFLDLPMLFLIVALGVTRPDGWSLFLAGATMAIALATALTVALPRLYPWGGKT